jgi:hypothetical protein
MHLNAIRKVILEVGIIGLDILEKIVGDVMVILPEVAEVVQVEESGRVPIILLW